MANTPQSAEAPAEPEPDSTTIEALKRERVAAFMADLGVAGESRYLPIPRALLQYDQAHPAAA